MYNKFFSSVLAMTLATGTTFAGQSPVTAVVNFSTCITDSKYGKKEQEALESLRKQMASLIEGTEQQLKELATKFEDTEYLDSLSPKAEEELKTKFQTLQEELGRYQNQFYQVLQHANYQMLQKVNGSIANAAKEVAEKNKIDYVINREVCFYVRPDLDLTSQVITAMDKNFEVDSKKVSENEAEKTPPEETKKTKAG